MGQMKAYLVGALGGAAVLAIVIFATGAVVTSSKAEESAAKAVVDVQALICEGLARAYLAESGDETDLKGYRQRNQRNELARKFAPILPGVDTADRAVVRACANKFS